MIKRNEIAIGAFALYVDFKEYDLFKDENLVHSNFVAIHRNHRPLINSLSSK